MKLSDIIRENAAYVERSGFAVECNSAYSTVAIGESIFMQGDEADQFNNQAEQLWNDTGDTTIEECRLHLAKDYIDCLE